MRVLTFILVLTALLAGSLLADPPAPDLTGEWILNEKESDAFAAPGRAGPPPDGGGGRGGGRGGGGRGFRGGSGDGGGPSADQQAMMEERKKAMSHLVIFQEDLELNVTDGLGISWLLFTDGRDMEIWTRQGMADATAAWEGAVLVIRYSAGEEGPEQVTRYSLDEDGTRLRAILTHQRPGEDENLTATMIYDRQE